MVPFFVSAVFELIRLAQIIVPLGAPSFVMEFPKEKAIKKGTEVPLKI